MYDKMLLTKIGSVVILISLFFSLLTSCIKTQDPFATDEVQTYENGYPIDPLEDFYSMTVAESRDKYGYLRLQGTDLNDDGKYNYWDITVKVMTDSGEKEVKTLGKCEHLREWAKPACTDPLCTHEHGSACPFANYENSSKMACYCGKLYFWTSGGDLYVYTAETNKSEILKREFHVYNFFRYDGSLYFIINEEDENFKAVRVAYKVTEDGELIRLFEYDGMEYSVDMIYNDRYVITRGYNIRNREDGHRIYEVMPEILMYDSQTGKTVTAFERMVPELENYANGVYGLFPIMIYGDILLAWNDYQMPGYEDLKYSVIKEELWLVDLTTFEKKLVSYKINNTYAGSFFLFSEKMILVNDPISDEESHRVIRLIDPYNGTEKVYDLTEAAKKNGQKLPSNNHTYLSRVEKGVAIFRGEPDENHRVQTILMCDLESGKIYIAPDAE